jgi:hypothetical protein
MPRHRHDAYQTLLSLFKVDGLGLHRPLDVSRASPKKWFSGGSREHAKLVGCFLVRSAWRHWE